MKRTKKIETGIEGNSVGTGDVVAPDFNPGERINTIQMSSVWERNRNKNMNRNVEQQLNEPSRRLSTIGPALLANGINSIPTKHAKPPALSEYPQRVIRTSAFRELVDL